MKFLVAIGLACALPLFAATSRIQSDWFSGNTISPVFWSTSLLRGGTAVQNGNELALTAPAAANHDNTAGWVQLTQTIADGDFDIIVKMDSKPPNQSGGTWYGPGITFLQDTNNGVYCEYVWNGFGNVYEFSCTKAVGGTQTNMVASRGNAGDPGPYYIEVIRSGDNWTMKYSLDGASWTTLWTFTQAFTINQMGLFANNYNSTPGNAQPFTGTFDYICNAVNDRCITRNLTRMFWFPAMGAPGGGQPVVPLVTITPASVNFGSQQVGTSSGIQPVTLANNSSSAIPVTAVSISGTNSSSFSQTNTCGSSVAANSNCTISTKFTPTANGSLSASLNVTTNPTVPAVSLSGIGTSIPTTACNPPRITVTGNNNSGDYMLLQNAVNGSGNVALNGTFAIGSNQVNVPAGTCISSTSGAQINATGSWAMNVTGDNITVNGLTFNGAGILTNFTTGYTFLNNHTITNNAFQNINNGNPAVNLQFAENNLNLSFNAFQNVGTPTWNSCTYSGTDAFPNAIQILSTLNNSKIDHNSFNQICGDAMHLADNLALKSDSTITAASNDEVGYNDFQNIWRIAIEWQGIAGGSGYDFSRQSITRNRSVIGNSYHNASKVYYQTWFNSLIAGTNTSVLNNTCIMTLTNPSVLGGQPASCFEVTRTPGTVLVQGNVTGTVSGAPSNGSFKWAYTVSQPNTGTAQTLQNNTHCGPVMNFWHFENTGTGGSTTVANNFNNYPSACPGSIASFTSTITPAWSSGNPTNFPAGGNGVWNMTVLSNLSIIGVNFYVDSTAGLPVATQTLSDVSTTFATDRKWMYHATINTSAYSNGNHTLYAVATDVTGATQTISATFHVGP